MTPKTKRPTIAPSTPATTIQPAAVARKECGEQLGAHRRYRRRQQAAGGDPTHVPDDERGLAAPVGDARGQRRRDGAERDRPAPPEPLGRGSD